MGDVAMTVPVIRALQASNAKVQIIVLTKKRFAPIFSGLENVHVHPVDVESKHKGLYGILKIFKELQQYQIDAVADLHNVLRSKILRSLFWLKGCPVVFVDKGRNEKKELTQWKSNKELYPLKTTHERYAETFDSLDLHFDISSTKLLPAKKWPLALAPIKKILIGIAPFASFASKQYPMQLVEETIKKVIEKIDCQIYLFGGGQREQAMLEALAHNFGDKVVNLAGKFSLDEELAIISNLSLMVSMDSGNGHLAANYGVPVITLWGVTHPALGFAPYGQPEENRLLADRARFPMIPTSVYGNKFPKGYEKAIASISPDAIVQRIQGLLAVG